MNVEKLLNVLTDLDDEETVKKIGTLLQEVINSLTQIVGNPSDQNFAKSFEEKLENLKNSFEDSISDEYTPSNYNIVKKLEIDRYYGINAWNHINSMLQQNNYNPQKLVQKLTEYNKERIKRVALLKASNSNLGELGFKAHFFDKEVYELGLMFLAESTKGYEIPEITKRLNRWNRILKEINELEGIGTQDQKIGLVSEGSLQFFIENSVETAAFLSLAIERIVKLYKNILEIRNLRSKMNELKFPKSEKDSAKKHESDLIEKELISIKKEIITKYSNKNIKQERINELDNSLLGHLKFIAKSLDDGEIIEIIPPEIDEPEILGEEDSKNNQSEKAKAQKLYKKQIANINLIKKSMDSIKELGPFGKEAFKYLNPSKDNED